MRLWGLPAVAALVLCTGCGLTINDFRTRKPSPPPLPAASPAEGERTYQDHRLEYRGGWGGPNWRRSDGAYDLGEIDPLLVAIPETVEPRAHYRRRLMVLSVIGGLAGALVGVTYFYNRLAPAERRWSTEARIASYGTAGALTIGVFVTSWAWTDPGPEVAAAYNTGLRRTLGLGPAR